MALFFTLGSAVMIKAGKKTHTMRLWTYDRVKEGRTYKAKLTRRSESTFAMIKITSVRQWDGVEPLGQEHAIKEGFKDRESDIMQCLSDYAISVLTKEMFSIEAGLKEAGVIVKTPKI